MESDIDFVITWVDGSDPKWLKDRAKFLGEEKIDEARYRDWGLLKYWFRAVEENAPWVRKIHFVTYGHYPKWLNTKNPKLHIVKHEEFIDKKYLPTFNSCAIEMNLHRIPGLSEKFVYFNDDMFLNKKIKPDFFFKNGEPVDFAPFGMPRAKDYTHYSICANNIILLNKYFDKRKLVKEHWRKFLSPKYGIRIIKTILALPWEEITGFDEIHTCSPMLRSSFDELWRLEKSTIESTCASKTRNEKNYNQYLFKYWAFCDGNFRPRSNSAKCYKPLDSKGQKESTLSEIKKPKHNTFCINDSKGVAFDNDVVAQIISRFEKRYNFKSSFEK